MDTGPISDFFDRKACCEGPADGVAGISGLLVEALEAAGLQGASVLELGCGSGELALEMLRRGGATVTGVDLSPASIDAARRAAGETGLSSRSAFVAGDAARIELAPHDVVVSDKAICCYPDPDALLANSLPAARATYAFALPASRGASGLAARAVIGFENTLRWIRRDPFRAFVHDVRRIDATVRAGGFVRVNTVRHWMWHVAVYARRGSVSG